jgi:hypothetical protein
MWIIIVWALMGTDPPVPFVILNAASQQDCRANSRVINENNINNMTDVVLRSECVYSTVAGIDP